MKNEQHERDIGRRLDHDRMLAQIDYALVLADRDGPMLADCGWVARDTEELGRLRGQIAALADRFRELYGGPRARDKRVAELVWHAKRWRLRALAVGRNGLESEARRELESLSRPTYSDPGLLASVLQGLLSILETNREQVGSRGADEAFLAEGRDLLQALGSVASGREVSGLHARLPEDAAQVSRSLDEACGRAWKMLKNLNLSGRTAHLLRGDRQRAAEYHLDLLREEEVGEPVE